MSRLLDWLLNSAYFALLLVASPWIIWSAIRHGKYREGWAQKFLGQPPRLPNRGPRIWFHAVSVGEVNLLGVLVQQLRQARPDVELVISTTTKTGYQLAKKQYPTVPVWYCPLDFSWAVGAALRRIRPTMLVLMELELWPNLIRIANRRGTRIAIVNGRLSDNSFRGYRRIKPLVASILRRLDLISAQDEPTAERFRVLGAPAGNVQTSGSLKFDGALTDRNNPCTNALRRLAGVRKNDDILLFGSTQAPEEEMALSTYQTLVSQHARLRLILVPRHPERFEQVAQLVDQSGLRWARRSGLPGAIPQNEIELSSDQAFATGSNTTQDDWQVLLVDAIGELAAWWGVATVGFVGGSFGDRGGQNMIEPAGYGVPVCFGPNTWNFRDVVRRLLEADSAVVVRNQDELTTFFSRCLTDRAYATELGRRASSLVAQQQGAAARTTVQLLRLLPPAAVNSANSPVASAARVA